MTGCRTLKWPAHSPKAGVVLIDNGANGAPATGANGAPGGWLIGNGHSPRSPAGRTHRPLRDALRFDKEHKGYSGCTGQGSDDDLGPRSVLPSKAKWSE
jgi:hypothetical protein